MSTTNEAKFCPQCHAYHTDETPCLKPRVNLDLEELEKVIRERDTLKHEVERLQRDKERLDWLLSHSNRFWGVPCTRGAIDILSRRESEAAMAKEKV